MRLKVQKCGITHQMGVTGHICKIGKTQKIFVISFEKNVFICQRKQQKNQYPLILQALTIHVNFTFVSIEEHQEIDFFYESLKLDQLHETSHTVFLIFSNLPNLFLFRSAHLPYYSKLKSSSGMQLILHFSQLIRSQVYYLK